MKKKAIIGIDFDKVFVNYPPFIPSSLIEYLYKKKNHKLSYRVPNKIEQKIRHLSHSLMLRPPIKDNIRALQEIAKDNSNIFLVSSRFSFLKDRTQDWDKKHGISKYFKKMYFNYTDDQPHFFKDRIIKEEKIEKFIDDDLDLLIYLAQHNSKVNFYWLHNGSSQAKLPDNIHLINTLEEFRTKYL